MLDNERLKTVNSLLTQKFNNQANIIEDQDWLKTKNRGLVSKIEQSRIEILSLKGDLYAKDSLIRTQATEINVI